MAFVAKVEMATDLFPTEFVKAAACEKRGEVYEFDTGDSFLPYDDYLETAQIWKRERVRRGLPVTWGRLQDMIEQAFELSEDAAALVAWELWFDAEWRSA